MVIMVVEISDFFSRVEASQYTIFTQKFHSSVSKTLRKYKGAITSTDNNSYVVVFESVIDAVQCALDIQHKFKYVTPKHKSFSRRLKIALSTVHTTKKEAISIATRMCENLKDQVAITSDVKNRYEGITEHAEIDNNLIRTLNPVEEKWLTKIMDNVESNWNKAAFSVSSLSNALGYTYSQLYHRLLKLTGKTPNNFIKEFKLHNALVMLYKHKGTITQVAYKSGFNSPTYFSDCFLQKYGIRPSKYVQQHTL